MKIEEYGSLSDFNSKLDEAVQELSSNWEGKKVERKQCDGELESIKKSIKTNHSLISESSDPAEALRYIKTVKQLTGLTKAIGKPDEYFATEMKTTALFFKNLSKDNVKESADTIGKLKEVEEDLYLDTLAEWLNAQKVPIKETGLSEEEMLKLAPKLTHLDLTDGELERGELKNCTFSEEFIGKLLENSLNLNSLSIKNSIITGAALVQLPKLRALQQLTIEVCPAFNQPLPDNLAELQQLTIYWCDAFNQKLSDNLAELQQLTITRCHAFNQKLPDNLAKLQQLTITRCHAFNQKLPDNLAELQQLTIMECPAFNQKLPDNLAKLQQLRITGCDTFNQPLPDNLAKLQQLRITGCDTFNQKLPDNLAQLQQLRIEWCPAFNPFDHPVNTALVILRFDQNLLLFSWKRLSVGRQEEYKKNNPKMDILLTLADIEAQVKKEEPASVIGAAFSSIREQENHIDYLKETIQYFPLLTSYLIQNYREEVIQDIEKIGVSFDDLSKEARLALLPLLPPNTIQKTVVEIPREEREGWLQESIQFEQFSGAIKDVLKEIKIKNIDSGEETVFDNLGTEFRNLLQEVPLKTMAALASDDSYAEVVLAYLPIMVEAQVAVVIPLLSAEQFSKHVRKQSLPIHKDLLAHATAEQKELYLKDDLIQSPDFQKWEKDFRPKLEQLIEAFNKDPTAENYQKLDFEWLRAYSSISTAIKQYKMVLSSLEKVLSMHAPGDEILGITKKTITDKKKQTEALEKELEQKKNLIVVELAKKLPEEEGVPDEFVDLIMATPMEDPWKDAHGNVLDKTTWNKSTVNPFTKEPLTEGFISPDTDLKKRIDAFKEKYPDLWKKAFE